MQEVFGTGLGTLEEESVSVYKSILRFIKVSLFSIIIGALVVPFLIDIINLDRRFRYEL